MRFCLVNRYFWPDESATSMLLSDLAEDLAVCGHEVHVMTSRQLYNQPRARLPAYQVWQRVHVHRLFSTSFGRRSFLGRLFDLMSFRWSLTAKQMPPPDAWFVMTDPPLILEQVVKLRQRSSGRIIHHVDDVYPDLAVALGAMPGGGLVKRWMNRRFCKAFSKCDHVLALGECMADVLKRKGISEKRISVTPPWADGTRIRPLTPSENTFRRELGLSESDFVVMYSGNIGRGHRFETIFKAASKLDRDGHIKHIFIGDGAKREDVELSCARHQLKNFHLLPYQPRERLSETLSAGDVHLISLDSRVQGLMVPSKLAGILAAGRPVVFIGDHENSVARAIVRGKCGFVLREGEVKKLQILIKGLKNVHGRCLRLGTNARSLFEREFDRTVIVPKIISYLTGVVHEPRLPQMFQE